jgi:L-serine dehydratase
LGLAKAIEVDFYAFLSVTDKRHATVLTGILRLTNENRKRRVIGEICEIIAFITNQKVLQLDGVHSVKFNPKHKLISIAIFFLFILMEFVLTSH